MPEMKRSQPSISGKNTLQNQKCSRVTQFDKTKMSRNSELIRTEHFKNGFHCPLLTAVYKNKYPPKISSMQETHETIFRSAILPWNLSIVDGRIDETRSFLIQKRHGIARARMFQVLLHLIADWTVHTIFWPKKAKNWNNWICDQRGKNW